MCCTPLALTGPTFFGKAQGAAGSSGAELGLALVWPATVSQPWGLAWRRDHMAYARRWDRFHKTIIIIIICAIN